MPPPVVYCRLGNGARPRLRPPIRISTTKSDAYIRGDPFLKLLSEEAAYRKFLVAAPGALSIVGPQGNIVWDVLNGKYSPRDAVMQAARDMQAALDKAQGRA